MTDEETPLLGRRSFSNDSEQDFPGDPHKQFCALVGIPPSDQSHTTKRTPGRGAAALYERAMKKRKSQSLTYTVTAALSNTLLLSQVLLGATLTALGASESSHVLITIFGVLNTVIAGLVAYLKSRGQPMRARMFRDDLDHVVDEIENSETMWLGITKHAHGYDEIDIDDEVSVRSEVARLTRLYDHAVKNYAQNNPDLYQGTGILDPITGLRARPGTEQPLPGIAGAVPTTTAAPAADAAGSAAPPAAPAAPDADESPATAKPKAPTPPAATEPKDSASAPKDAPSAGGTSATAASAPSKPAKDDEAQPATAPPKPKDADKSADADSGKLI